MEKQFKQLVKKIQAENFELEVQIFRPFHREIIGKNGSTIAKIREETHTRINVPAADEGKDTITVIGTEENCKKAQQMMLAIQDQVAKIETKEVPIPSKLHPYIIGPKGRVVASLSEEFGVQIVFPSGEQREERKICLREEGCLRWRSERKVVFLGYSYHEFCPVLQIYRQSQDGQARHCHCQGCL